MPLHGKSLLAGRALDLAPSMRLTTCSTTIEGFSTLHDGLAPLKNGSTVLTETRYLFFLRFALTGSTTECTRAILPTAIESPALLTHIRAQAPMDIMLRTPSERRRGNMMKTPLMITMLWIAL